MVITATISSFSARSGMTRIAIKFLSFKAEELSNYVDSQWNLLVNNQLSDNPAYVEVAKNAIQSYAASIVKSDTELIFAVDKDSNIVMSTRELRLGIEEKSRLYDYLAKKKSGWITMTAERRKRVGYGFYFQPFDWYFFVTEDEEVFYRESRQIIVQTAYVLGGTIVFSIFLLIIFTGYLIRPLRSIVATMRHVISTNDMSHRVPVEFKDEIGTLAHTFNIMTGELEKAYVQIKQFALKSVLAEKNERKIRNIFQKYVPKDVIDTIFKNPEKMLIGDNRVVAILFSDIRSFTTISEGYMPDELVSTLNKYFEMMVDIIIRHNGVIDKYIGDAIMAFFGAPVKRPDDAVQAVYAAIEMQEALLKFNEEQVKNGKPEFRTGIGINYGVVTVGNIGSEKKMDYTIIGDMVNLGSRLEGLTKPYKQGVIFSESVYRKTKDVLPCRMIDKVVVKGKTQGESIYTAKKSIKPAEKKAWAYHAMGLKHYYKMNFKQAAKYFIAVRKLQPGDHVAGIFLERCKKYIKNRPPKDWNGLEVLTSK